MPRKLSKEFIEDLLSGELSQVLKLVQTDPTLDFNIRKDYVNIYYRGGNILRITEKAPHNYKFEFDPKYKGSRPDPEMDRIQDILKSEKEDWLSFFPFAKQAMDFYFSNNPKEEREFAQVVVRDNNYSGASNGTDYFIIDYEYDNHQGARFDLVAVEWPSVQQYRKLTGNYRPKLVVMEMKYADGALKGSAGIVKHVQDFLRFLENHDQVASFKQEMVDLFKQKRMLGLVKFGNNGNPNQIEEFDAEIELQFLLSNHDPASTVLKEVTHEVTCQFPSFEVKIIQSNFLGYGLYNNKVSTLYTYNL
ncbi:MAG: hypothetical protein NTW16_09150 [Bacteroidetes bacterium]|nr:hypothetical protein [Bacteroidota bacterium]